MASQKTANYLAKSMTAFGRAEAEYELGSCSWEVRSVNHRYLDVSFKLPEKFRRLEPKLKERMRKRISRGKCDVGLQYHRSTAEFGSEVNAEAVNAILSAQAQVQAIAEKAAPLSTQQLLNWPGVLVEKDIDEDQLEVFMLKLFEKSLDEFVEARKQEGFRMAEVVDDRLQKISDIVKALESQLPAILQEYEQRLKNKIEEMQVEVDGDRLAQEMVLLAQKSDVAEELDRINAHVDAVRDAMRSKEPCGRRLDFLMQELNREANTLGSKSISIANSNGAIELKVLIEQMREQVQNIE